MHHRTRNIQSKTFNNNGVQMVVWCCTIWLLPGIVGFVSNRGLIWSFRGSRPSVSPCRNCGLWVEIRPEAHLDASEPVNGSVCGLMSFVADELEWASTSRNRSKSHRVMGSWIWSSAKCVRAAPLRWPRCGGDWLTLGLPRLAVWKVWFSATHSTTDLCVCVCVYYYQSYFLFAVSSAKGFSKNSTTTAHEVSNWKREQPDRVLVIIFPATQHCWASDQLGFCVCAVLYYRCRCEWYSACTGRWKE